MKKPSLRSIATSLALVGASLFVPAAASASHYDLVDVELVSAEVLTALQSEGIEDTKGLLEHLDTKAERSSFVKAHGMTEEEVQDLADVLELIQIIGVGPKAASLLRLSGVTSVEDLAQRQPEVLLEALLATNATHQVTGLEPDLLVVSDWIAKASEVAVKLER